LYLTYGLSRVFLLHALWLPIVRHTAGANTSIVHLVIVQHIVGCYATCSVDSIPKNGSCIATAGCCEAGVPDDLGYFEAYFDKKYNSSGCGYIAVMEEKAFNFSTTYLDPTKIAFWPSGMRTRAKFQL